MALNTLGYVSVKYIRSINLVKNGGKVYYLYNAHGDVVQTLEQRGGPIINSSPDDPLAVEPLGNFGPTSVDYYYDAFGVQENENEEDMNPWRYCGEYWDQETGTYYLRARYYNPSSGRFLSQDVFANINSKDPLSLNLYLYCRANPVNMYDETGEWPKWIIDLFLNKSDKEKVEALKPAEQKLVYKYPFAAKEVNKYAVFALDVTVEFFPEDSSDGTAANAF